MIIAQGGNLILRTWELSDAAQAFQFYGDPEVSKYIGRGKPAENVQQVERILLKFIEHQNQTGFSPWSVVDASTGQVVGVCGLHTFNEHQEIELGFRILRSRWAEGIATRSSTMAIRFVMDTIRPSQIIALTLPENIVTQTVLSKVGFTQCGRIFLNEASQDFIRYEFSNRLRPGDV